MNDQKQPKRDLSGAVAFATAVLGAVHMLTFVWLTALVYRDNIRGYVPAGVTGLTVLAVATLALVVYLAIVWRKQGRPGDFIPVGCLGAILGVLAASLYCRLLVTILGYTLQKDVGISASGAILFIAIAVMIQIRIRRKGSSQPAGGAYVSPAAGDPSAHT